MEDDIGDEWEVSQAFQRMDVRDEETGECWPAELCRRLSSDGPSYSRLNMGSAGASSHSHFGCCTKIAGGISRWRVPKEYSQLGRSSSPCLMDTQSDESYGATALKQVRVINHCFDFLENICAIL